MKTIITDTGFKCKVSEDITDDMEFLDILVQVSRGDMTYLPDMLIGLLGEKSKKALYEHCRDKNGRVRSSKVITEVYDIFDKIKGAGETEVKN